MNITNYSFKRPANKLIEELQHVCLEICKDASLFNINTIEELSEHIFQYAQDIARKYPKSSLHHLSFRISRMECLHEPCAMFYLKHYKDNIINTFYICSRDNDREELYDIERSMASGELVEKSWADTLWYQNLIKRYGNS